MRTSMCFNKAAACLSILVASATAQDPTKLAPDLYKTILDNDKVRVIDYRLAPGQREPIHSHALGVLVYFISDAKLRATAQDGSVTESRNSPGQIVWRDPATHSAENIGSTEAHAILIEPKVSCTRSQVPKPRGLNAGGTDLPAHLEPHHRVRFENRQVRALEVILQPGQSSLFHRHSHDIVYVVLADAAATPQNKGDLPGPQVAFHRGEASFDDASAHPFTHRLKNTGTTEFHTLNVEFCPGENSDGSSRSSAQDGEVIQQITALENELAGTVVARDYATLRRIEADSYVYTDSDANVNTRDEFIDAYKTGKSEIPMLRFHDIVVDVYPNTAMVRGILTVDRTDNGVHLSRSSRYTRVYVRFAGAGAQW